MWALVRTLNGEPTNRIVVAGGFHAVNDVWIAMYRLDRETATTQYTVVLIS